MNNMVALLVFFVIVSSTLMILFFLIKLINVKTRNTLSNTKQVSLNEYMNRLDNIIMSNVIATNQTLVGPLKEANSFSQLDKEEAFESCRERIYSFIKDENIDEYSSYIGNMDEWIVNRIEYHVKMNKGT